MKIEYPAIAIFDPADEGSFVQRERFANLIASLSSLGISGSEERNGLAIL